MTAMKSAGNEYTPPRVLHEASIETLKRHVPGFPPPAPPRRMIMYCAGCGQTLTNQAACPQCGRRVGSAGPRAVSEAVAAYVFQRTVRRLQQAWFLFACLNVALGVTGLALV